MPWREMLLNAMIGLFDVYSQAGDRISHRSGLLFSEAGNWGHNNHWRQKSRVLNLIFLLIFPQMHWRSDLLLQNESNYQLWKCTNPLCPKWPKQSHTFRNSPSSRSLRQLTFACYFKWSQTTVLYSFCRISQVEGSSGMAAYVRKVHPRMLYGVRFIIGRRERPAGEGIPIPFVLADSRY